MDLMRKFYCAALLPTIKERSLCYMNCLNLNGMCKILNFDFLDCKTFLEVHKDSCIGIFSRTGIKAFN